MKYINKKYICLLLVSILILTSCGIVEDNEHIIEGKIDLNIEDILDSNISEDWNIISYNLLNPYEEEDLDYYISSSCQGNGFIYYASSGSKPMSNDCIVYDILKKDIVTNEIEKIITKNENNLNQLSVMKYINDNLFWVEENQNSWSLIKYDLKEDEYEVLDSSEKSQSTLPPNIEAYDGFLFWYRITADNIITLIEYSLTNNRVKEYREENYYLESPFSTVKCNRGYMTYLTKDKEEININIKDLHTNELSIIKTKSPKIVSAISNKDYIIWLEDWNDSILNIYKLETKTLKSIDCYNNNIRSIGIDKSNILIDFSSISMGESKQIFGRRIDSGIFQFDFDNSILKPVYINKNNETTAWIDDFGGDFSINSWDNHGDEFMNKKILFIHK